MILLDASVLIALLDGSDAHHGAAERLLTETVDEELVTNTLTLAEVLVVPARDGRLDAVRTALGELGLRELPFPPDSAVGLAHLRATTGLKMPDCCVLLAGRNARCAVATFDDRLRKAARAFDLPVMC